MKMPDIKSWLWVVYPLCVLVLIFVTLSSRQIFDQLVQKQQKNSENQKTFVRLTNKLATLKQINITQTTQDLGWMVQVMPNKKQFDVLVNQLRFGAVSAGAALTSYKGGAGATPTDYNLTAEFLVPDFNSFQKLVATLENTLPLLTVSGVGLAGPVLTLDVSSAWAPIASASVKIDEPLPDYAAKLAQIKSSLAGFQVPVVTQPEGATTSGFVVSTDPFGPLPGSN